jgi:hypothetical protein
MYDANDPRATHRSGDDGRHRSSDSAADLGPEAVGLQADIERTRERLADTVDQLQDRLDVKARTAERARSLRAQAVDRATYPDGRPRPEAMAVAAAVAGLLVVALWRRRRARRRKG